MVEGTGQMLSVKLPAESIFYWISSVSKYVTLGFDKYTMSVKGSH